MGLRTFLLVAILFRNPGGGLISASEPEKSKGSASILVNAYAEKQYERARLTFTPKTIPMKDMQVYLYRWEESASD
jgi:hypothetical protein